jgi:hypothetical protein
MNSLRQIEQEVLLLGREWTRLELQKRLQAQCDQIPMESTPKGQPLENTRWREMELDTVSGKIKLRARHGRQPQKKQWICPARVAWGLKPYERKTPELQARLAYTATAVGSYAEAETMATTWGTPVSDGNIHQHVQSLGERAPMLVLPTPAAEKSEPSFSMVIMMDGWLARERGADWGAGPRKKNPERVDWKEIKSAVIYRLEQRVENVSGRGLLLEKNPTGNATSGIWQAGASGGPSPGTGPGTVRLPGDGWSSLVVGLGRGSVQGRSQNARFSPCSRAPACGGRIAPWFRDCPSQGMVESNPPSLATRQRDPSRSSVGETLGNPSAAFSRTPGNPRPRSALLSGARGSSPL